MLKLYHAPKSRSTRIIWLLEELGARYEVELVDIRRLGSTISPPESYRSVHPHLKVPALVHDGASVFESSAICAYLADAFPERGLAPPIGDKRRGPYLSWLVYASTVVGEHLSAKAAGWDINPFGVGFGSYEEMDRTLSAAVDTEDWITGPQFTAADIMIASVIRIGRISGNLVDREPYRNYLARALARPAFQKAQAMDAAWSDAQQ